MKKTTVLVSALMMAGCMGNSFVKSRVDLDPQTNLTGSVKDKFEQWATSISSSKQIPDPYGVQYEYAVPYYQVAAGNYSLPYNNEYKAARKTFKRICTSSGGQVIKVVEEKDTRFKFHQIDPSKMKNVPRHFSGCVINGELEAVLKTDHSKYDQEFYMALFTQADRDKYMAYVEQENKKIAERRKQLTKEFQENLSLGDQSQQGMVIEINGPLVKVQQSSKEKWIKLSSLKPRLLPNYIK